MRYFTLVRYEIIVVGGGLSGLRAAIEAKVRGADVAILSGTYPMRSHSVAAQGGINASLGNSDPSDNIEKHAFDTVKGSDYLADQDSVIELCKDAINRVRELDAWGCPFSRYDDGRIAQRPFGGAEFPRTCFAADKTGHAITHTVYQQALRLGVVILNEKIALRLAVDEVGVRGLVALDLKSGRIEALQAKAIIIATGGAGRVYSRTTNAHQSTGYGIAMASWAGVPMEDMEFVQFHPTTLLGSNILITEAARGEGGLLYNASGERFMQRYAPEKMELAPRDIVARAIWREILEGRGFDGGYVNLDITHLGAQTIMEKLPQIQELALRMAGVDATKEPIPVQPGQHYTMGGIETDSVGRTRVPGLFAAGECACVSVHGANRLGGNSLLDCLVFGARAGYAAAGSLTGSQFGGEAALEKVSNHIDSLIKSLTKRGLEEGSVNHHHIRKELQNVMWEDVGIFRDGERLADGLSKVKLLKEKFYNKSGVSGEIGAFDLDLVDALMLSGMLDVSLAIVGGALLRRESRGSHYRLDYNKRDDEAWLKHTLAFHTNEGPRFEYKPVQLSRWVVKEREY
jgi:succinate dehydrogenase / fumarate reductase flavoprotein subunit